MSGLPAGWVATALADVCLPVGKHDPRDRPGQQFEYIDIGGIADQRIEETKSLVGANAPSRARQIVRAGDTVLSTVRTYLRKTALVPPRLDGATASTGFCVLRPGPAVDSRFLFYRVIESGFVADLSAMQTGSSYPAVRDKDVFAQPIALPPMGEQLRIVAALDEHFSRLDVAGRLVRSCVRRATLLRNVVLVSVIPQPLPPHWQLLTVGDVGKVQLGRQRSPKFHEGPNMRPYLRVANVFEDRLDLSDVMEMDFPPDQFERYRLEPGDILLNEGQSPHLVGRPAMFRGEISDACFTNSLIRFQPDSRVDGEFALLVFRSHLHSGRFQQEARITTNIAHISAGRFKTVEFPLPPKTEQLAIVSETQRKLSLVDALERDVRSALQREKGLRQALLGSAFRGDLVPHHQRYDPSRTVPDGSVETSPHG